MGIWDWLTNKGHASQPVPGPASKGAERRGATRYPGSRVTSCHLVKLPESIPVQAELRDLSISGIGLCCHRPVEAGAFLVVTLVGAKQFSCTMQARVVHATQQTKEDWSVGAFFTRELTEEELAAFM